MIELKCSYRTGIGRFDTYDYVRAINFDVITHDDNDQEVILGKVSVDQVMVMAAQTDGEYLYRHFRRRFARTA